MKMFHVGAAIAFVWLPMDAAFALALGDGNYQRASSIIIQTELPEGDQTPPSDDAEQKAGAEAAVPAADPVPVEVAVEAEPQPVAPDEAASAAEEERAQGAEDVASDEAEEDEAEEDWDEEDDDA